MVVEEDKQSMKIESVFESVEIKEVTEKFVMVDPISEVLRRMIRTW